jgi:hypothetical protein
MTAPTDRLPRLIQPLTVYQGETWAMVVELSGDDAPANIDGWTIRMDWRTQPGAVDRIARFDSGTPNVEIEPGEPKATFRLSAEATAALPGGRFAVDCFFERPDQSQVLTFVGPVEIYRRVTRVED